MLRSGYNSLVNERLQIDASLFSTRQVAVVSGSYGKKTRCLKFATDDMLNIKTFVRIKWLCTARFSHKNLVRYYNIRDAEEMPDKDTDRFLQPWFEGSTVWRPRTFYAWEMELCKGNCDNLMNSF